MGGPNQVMGQNLPEDAFRYGREDSIYCQTTQILAGSTQPDNRNQIQQYHNFGYEKDGSRGKVSHTDFRRKGCKPSFKFTLWAQIGVGSLRPNGAI